MPFVSWMSSSLLSIFQLNIEVTPTLILTGAGAFVALLVLSSIFLQLIQFPWYVVPASIMKSLLHSKSKNALTSLAYSSQLPKILELVGTGYSIWFIARYLIYKESIDSLFGKFEDLKQRII